MSVRCADADVMFGIQLEEHQSGKPNTKLPRSNMISELKTTKAQRFEQQVAACDKNEKRKRVHQHCCARK